MGNEVSSSSSPASGAGGLFARLRGSQQKWDPQALEKRQLVLAELVETERSYVKSLEHLVQHVIRPLKTNLDATSGATSSPQTDAKSKIKRRMSFMPAKSKSLIKEKHLVVIFSNVEELHELHERLLARLVDERVASGGEQSEAGRVFLEFAPVLDAYSQYVCQYGASVTTLSKVKLGKRGKELRTFLNEAKTRCDGHDLSSLLIMPVQRLPRYVLLLRECLKTTPTWAKDYGSLTAALAAMELACVKVNSSTRVAENVERVVDLSDQIFGVFGGNAVARRSFAHKKREMLARGHVRWIQDFDQAQFSAALSANGAVKVKNASQVDFVVLTDCIMFLAPSTKGIRRKRGYLVLAIEPLSKFTGKAFVSSKSPSSFFQRLFSFGASNDADLPQPETNDVAKGDVAASSVLELSGSGLFFYFEALQDRQLPEHFGARSWASELWKTGGAPARELFLEQIRATAADLRESPLDVDLDKKLQGDLEWYASSAR